LYDNFSYQSINKDLRELKTRMQTIFDEKEQLQSENSESTKQKAKLELTIKDIQDDLEGDAKTKVKYELSIAHTLETVYLILFQIKFTFQSFIMLPH